MKFMSSLFSRFKMNVIIDFIIFIVATSIPLNMFRIIFIVATSIPLNMFRIIFIVATSHTSKYD